ncbi:MAG: hypothetical protein KGN33_18175 [Paracoccaceae bacterium]|nr:hypothetical protein [Paracoccaceae bacterium]
MLTFAQFLATAEPLSREEAARRLEVDSDTFGDAVSLTFFAGMLYVEHLPDGSVGVMIERSYYTGSTEDVARRLYVDWYASEYCSTYSTVALSDYLAQFAKVYKLPLKSADEMLADLPARPEDGPARQVAAGHMLQWFIATWDATQDHEDAQRRASRPV